MSILIFIILNLILFEVNAFESDSYKIPNNSTIQNYKKSEPSEKKINQPQQIELKEIPKTLVSEEEKNFLRDRNPFLPPGREDNNSNESINISGIVFKGIAKIGSESVVFIESNKETNAYELGQNIGGGFKISKIDNINLEVQISNQNITHSIKLEKDE